MVEIFLLEQFVAFAQCGTLSRAAVQLHISQPALSRSMKKLEDLFGIPCSTAPRAGLLSMKPEKSPLDMLCGYWRRIGKW